ncbi:hypothetical protein D3C80_1579540 [compost metagenome]
MQHLSHRYYWSGPNLALMSHPALIYLNARSVLHLMVLLFTTINNLKILPTLHCFSNTDIHFILSVGHALSLTFYMLAPGISSGKEASHRSAKIFMASRMERIFTLKNVRMSAFSITFTLILMLFALPSAPLQQQQN